MAVKQKKPEWEWLSLLDIDGPFLSRAALKSFYRSGLPKPHASVDDVNATVAEEFKRWSATWSAAPERYRAARDRWVEVVLRTLLDWSDELEIEPDGLRATSPNGAVVITPWAALRDADSAPAALVTLVDTTKDLRAAGTDGWAANAIDRMAVLLRETGTTIGIVTDGLWWALVSAAKDVTTASGVWDSSLWQQERPSRDAFLALASFASIAGGQPDKRLPRLFAESVTSAEQITEALGDQVRRAVELVLQSMSDTHLRALAAGESSPLPEDGRLVYEGAVTMLMRIVFLLFAEERGLLPEHDLYRSAYAIAGLREDLQHEATVTSAEALDHSWEAWHRLLAASNAVYCGASFEDMRMPAYGGSLFDPDRFPWLQVTDAQELLRVRLTDRAMLAVLRAVQTIEDGAMQLSFRDLDVEQIGYVYEGLLSYSAEYVTDVTVGLEGKSGYEPEISLAALETIASSAPSPADFAKRLIDHLKQTQEKSVPRTAHQISKAYGAVNPESAADARTRLRYVLLGDDGTAARLQPFHALIRNDLREFPYVVPANGLVMAESPQRANTGTHYTPRSLAEEVVLHTLEPLVYSPGPLDTEDSNAWKLRSSAEILNLKVADIAAGSGAFLVAAARYLADRLIEARAQEGIEAPGEANLQRWAIREIVARCLYGADINGTAIEMSKLSLWLISMDPGKPFSFVDDRVFHGNSLLGVMSEAQLKAQHIYPEARAAKTPLRWFDVDKDLDAAVRLRRELASGQVNDADLMRSTRAKRALLAQSRETTARLRMVADGVIAAGLLEGGRPGRKLEDRYDDLSDALRDAYPLDGTMGDDGHLRAIIEAGLTLTNNTGEERVKPLHWLIEAPDVIRDHGGFDAIIGNPPFLGGQKLRGALGARLREWLIFAVSGGSKGSADLVAYFLIRVATLLRPAGVAGLIATNTVAQGETRSVGLARLLDSGVRIIRSIRSAKWPSASANLNYAALWFTTSLASLVQVVADGERVQNINASLEAASTQTAMPQPLEENKRMVFQGTLVLGLGFVLDPEAAAAMKSADPSSTQVLAEYLTGEDINSRPLMDASRYVINFKDLSEAQASQYVAAWGHVEANVRPDRQRTRADGNYVLRRPLPQRWWQFAERATGLYAAISTNEYVIALSFVSKSVMPARLPNHGVFSHKLAVFVDGSYANLAYLSSAVHLLWAISHSSTLEDRVSYSPTDAYLTLPRPLLSTALEQLGAELEKARRLLMIGRNIGLTATYNLVNSPIETSADVEALRRVHREIDRAVFDSYGWFDKAVEHDHVLYRDSVRYTITAELRVWVFERLYDESRKRSARLPDLPKVRPGEGLDKSEKPDGAMF